MYIDNGNKWAKMTNKTGRKVVNLQRQPYGGWRCDVFCEGGAGAFAVQSGDDPTLNDSGRRPINKPKRQDYGSSKTN